MPFDHPLALRLSPLAPPEGSAGPDDDSRSPVGPGRVLFDQYRIERKLGAGGFGSVWLVRNLPLNVDRALKLIEADIADDPQVQARFRREARLLAKLTHPNVVNVYNAGIVEGVAFLEMEYVEGKNLGSVMRAGRPLPLALVSRIVEQLCDVLQAAHDQGIVHRDLKPSNLMLVGDGRLKVLDFGIAKALDGARDDVHTLSGGFLGTTHYASPEQIRGASIDPRSDLYSIGVILYELLTGQRPFGGTMQRVMLSHLTEAPPPFSVVAPGCDVPEAVERVVLRCLEKDPANRPQTARELAEEFRRAVGLGRDLPPSALGALMASPDDADSSVSRPRSQPSTRTETFVPENFTRSIVEGGRWLGALEAQAAIGPGQTIFGRYRVVRLLGGGGFGQVWLVEHLDLEVPRALKTILPAKADDEEARAWLRHEARVTAKLIHPHAVTIHDARFANGLTFIDMEYLPGKSLREVLRPGEPVSLDWTARVLEQTCSALQAAHDLGIVHRDLKPSNLMLLDGFPEGREFVKLVDFGVAGLRGAEEPGSQPGDGRIYGTMAYSSPEGLRGDPTDARSDIYSLGVLLYEFLAGRKPFEGPPLKLLASHFTEPPPPIASSHVPPPIERLIRSCLEKDPAHRPKTAREVAERFLWSLPPRYPATPGRDPGSANRSDLRPPPDYRLIRWLGGGGFGEVWEAQDDQGVHVALKFVRLDREEVGRAEWRALEIIKNIRHPNLLVPFKSWQSSDHLVIGMELANKTLRQRLDECRTLGYEGIPRDELLEYLLEAAKGLDFLNDTRHELADGKKGRIYHSDVKPQNILLMGGAVKVADFGLSRFTDHSITARDAAMTFQYAAPEFLKGQVARQSDQYSLAVTYCLLRGGRLPFDGKAPEVIMAGHLARQPDLSMLPARERPIVHRALSKEPKARWKDCRTFVRMLAEVGQSTTNGRPRRSWWSKMKTQLVRLIPGRSSAFDTTQDWASPGPGPGSTRWTPP